MAQANSVPIAIRTPITGATSKASPKRPRRSRYAVISGGMPIGTYIVAAFYATAVILLACAPWNFLLILGLLLSKDDVLRFWISSRWGRAS